MKGQNLSSKITPAPHLTKQLLLHLSTETQRGLAGAAEAEVVSVLIPCTCFRVFYNALA